MDEVRVHDEYCGVGTKCEECGGLHGPCICDKLAKAENRGYRKGWDASARYVAEQAKPILARNAKDTSRHAVERNAGSIRGRQLEVYNLVKGNPLGLTDFELEQATGAVHQSISAARRALVVAGLVTDSGKRRKNSRGNDSIVWVTTSPSSKEADAGSDRGDDPVPQHTHLIDPYNPDTCAACQAQRRSGGTSSSGDRW